MSDLFLRCLPRVKVARKKTNGSWGVSRAHVLRFLGESRALTSYAPVLRRALRRLRALSTASENSDLLPAAAPEDVEPLVMAVTQESTEAASDDEDDCDALGGSAPDSETAPLRRLLRARQYGAPCLWREKSRCGRGEASHERCENKRENWRSCDGCFSDGWIESARALNPFQHTLTYTQALVRAEAASVDDARVVVVVAAADALEVAAAETAAETAAAAASRKRSRHSRSFPHTHTHTHTHHTRPCAWSFFSLFRASARTVLQTTSRASRFDETRLVWCTQSEKRRDVVKACLLAIRA